MPKTNDQNDDDAATEEEVPPVIRPPRPRKFGYRAGADAEIPSDIVIIDRRGGGDRVRPI